MTIDHPQEFTRTTRHYMIEVVHLIGTDEAKPEVPADAYWVNVDDDFGAHIADLVADELRTGYSVGGSFTAFQVSPPAERRRVTRRQRSMIGYVGGSPRPLTANEIHDGMTDGALHADSEALEGLKVNGIIATQHERSVGFVYVLTEFGRSVYKTMAAEAKRTRRKVCPSCVVMSCVCESSITCRDTNGDHDLGCKGSHE